MKNPKLLWEYIKEREGKEVVECEDGFALYEIIGRAIYLSDIYVVPEKRRTRVCYDLADKVVEIAKENNCTILLGSIDPKLETKEQSESVLKNYGYEFVEHENLLDWYKKDI